LQRQASVGSDETAVVALELEDQPRSRPAAVAEQAKLCLSDVVSRREVAREVEEQICLAEPLRTGLVFDEHLFRRHREDQRNPMRSAPFLQ
jgi:hypothetical protein